MMSKNELLQAKTLYYYSPMMVPGKFPWAYEIIFPYILFSFSSVEKRCEKNVLVFVLFLWGCLRTQLLRSDWYLIVYIKYYSCTESIMFYQFYLVDVLCGGSCYILVFIQFGLESSFHRKLHVFFRGYIHEEL